METSQSTPDNKTNITPNLSEQKLNGGSIRKSFFTPCRRVGLGKSPRNIKRTPDENMCSNVKTKNNTPEHRGESSGIKESTTPKTECILKPRRRHAINNLIRDSIKKQSSDLVTNVLKDSELEACDIICENVLEIGSPFQNNLRTKNDSLHLEITDGALIDIALQIKEKQAKLKECGIQLIPNDLLHLKESINIWRTAAQRALKYLIQINTERGYPITLAELIETHGLNSELLNFVPEEDDFV